MDFATSYSLLRGYLVEDVIPLMMKEDDLYFFHNNKVASKVASIGIMAMTKENIHHCGLFFEDPSAMGTSPIKVSLGYYIRRQSQLASMLTNNWFNMGQVVGKR